MQRFSLHKLNIVGIERRIPFCRKWNQQTFEFCGLHWMWTVGEKCQVTSAVLFRLLCQLSILPSTIRSVFFDCQLVYYIFTLQNIFDQQEVAGTSYNQTNKSFGNLAAQGSGGGWFIRASGEGRRQTPHPGVPSAALGSVHSFLPLYKPKGWGSTCAFPPLCWMLAC